MFIEVESLSFKYGSRQALRDINVRLARGVTGLLGPNGAGKSTLLNVVAGIDKPATGTVRVVDGSANSALLRGKVGYLPQRFTFATELTVRDTVAYAAWVNGRRGRDLDTLVEKSLHSVGLSEKRDQRVRSLSGGQRQRLGIATALAHEPAILILDEPTVGLDPQQRLRVREVIKGIGATTPVVLSTHLVEDITYLCRDVVILVSGRLAYQGTVVDMATRLLYQTGTVDESLGSDVERAYSLLLEELAPDE